MKNKPAIPESLLALLDQSDKRQGFPAGTMLAVLNQEVGGNVQSYLDDPARYHYTPDASGKRIAKHTGKESTAFGPFGILESTGAKPGFGVAPLKNKSLEEQVRFASDYLGARVKSMGSLEAGLAGYGEGPAYAQQVLGRLGQPASPPRFATKVDVPAAASVAAPAAAPVQQAAAPSDSGPVGFVPTEAMVQAMKLSVAPQASTADPPPVYRASETQSSPDWDNFVQAMPQQQVQSADFGRWLNYMSQSTNKTNPPNFKGFAPFEGWKV